MPERAEEARAVMIELFPEGFEESELAGEVELAAYTGPGGEERLWQVFGPGEKRDVEAGWAEAWQRFHKPVRIGRLWVGPPWEEPDEGLVAVVVDPGRAFGTGAHPTTRLCLELLLELQATSVLDLGCGSGVLAIAAAKLGFHPVHALDLDEAALEATRANASANAVDLDVRCADVLADPLPNSGLALANIAWAPIGRLAERVRAPLFVCSGYLISERPDLPGWRHEVRREADGWAADVFAPL